MCVHCLDDFPIARDLVAAHELLSRLNYTTVARTEALAHVALHGTAEGCRSIDRADCPAVEKLLPRSTRWQDARWDEHVWALGAEDDEGH